MSAINDEFISEAVNAVRSSDRCLERLPMGVRPVVQLHSSTKILIAGLSRERGSRSTSVVYHLMIPANTITRVDGFK